MEFTSISNALLGYLRGRIITSALRPGEKIHENELAAELKISRGPLREAFRVLEQESLVVNIPRKGTFVTRLSDEDLEEIFRVRGMIELTALDILQERDIRDLPLAREALQLARKMQETGISAVHTDESLLYRERIVDFHAKLVKEAGNSRLLHFYETLYFSLARYQQLYFTTAGSYSKSLKAHSTILEQIQAGRYNDAKQSLLSHLQATLSLAKGALKKNGHQLALSHEKTVNRGEAHLPLCSLTGTHDT